MIGDTNRNFSRVPLSRLVRYREDPGSDFHSALVANISLGGLYIRTDRPYAVGTKVYLQFTLENGEIVAEGWARVVHGREQDQVQFGSGMGLEFTSVDEKFVAFTQLVVSQELISARQTKSPT